MPDAHPHSLLAARIRRESAELQKQLRRDEITLRRRHEFNRLTGAESIARYWYDQVPATFTYVSRPARNDSGCASRAPNSLIQISDSK